MLRINVAPDQFATGRWIIHLFAGDGDEHIFQVSAASAPHAARLALGDYDKVLNGRTLITKILCSPAPDYYMSAPEYPDTTRYVFSVDD